MPKPIKSLSLLSVILLGLITVAIRAYYTGTDEKPMRVTTWDGLGYYQNLPAVFIYQDITKMEWFEEQEKKYDLTGGHIYQLGDLPNGNRVAKYTVGVSIMQAPFFLIAHGIANATDFEADGFSAPYQYSIAYGIIVYFILALFILRKVLLKYFDEKTTALSLTLLVLCTNILQYISYEGGMSHGYIFLLYTILLYATMKWHEKPSFKYSALIGATIGFAIICRVTEAVMIFIPILWGIHNKESRKLKWELIKQHKKQLLWIGLFGFIALIPQLIYWQVVTGSPIHKMGSKWQFFNPWFRVLFGIEKGWFVYTPITILFVAGFFYLKKYPFQKAVLFFCLINIWIIISWHEWKYGATYSTRALIQSYPIFILAFAAIIKKILEVKWKYAFFAIATFLTFLNLFQIKQYNERLILNDGMNFQYYKAIFLNPNPDARDMSLIYTEDLVDASSLEQGTEIIKITDTEIAAALDSSYVLYDPQCLANRPSEIWVNMKIRMKTDYGEWTGLFKCEYSSSTTKKTREFPLITPLTTMQEMNEYEFDFIIPKEEEEGQFVFSIETDNYLHAFIDELVITSGTMN